MRRDTGACADHDVQLQMVPAWVHADATRLQQMVTNLLTNAIKYTPAHKRITVTVVPDVETVSISVSDDGIGIAPQAYGLIAVTGYAQPDDVERAKRAGFDQHLAKPLDPTKLSLLLESGPQVS